MIYDCFTFFNELDLLEIRLNTLNDVVDKFVLVEGTKSFTNHDKPLYFEQNKKRFSNFLHKIIHVVVDNFPTYTGDPWVYENFQRNAIAKGLSNCIDDDIIMISDLDEIPNPQKILEVKDLPGIKALDMNMFFYSLNNLKVGSNWTSGTKILSYKDFKSILDDVSNYSLYNPEFLNQGTTANKIRLYKKTKNQKHFYNSGWHFSYIGNKENIIKKLENFSHKEIIENSTAEKEAENLLNNFQSNNKYLAIMIDKSFPKYLYENQDKYKHLITTPNTTKTLAELSKKSQPKEYLRMPCKILLNLIPNKEKRAKLRQILMQKTNLSYI